jgi:ATP-dependent RNA helicase DDX52/ROK1
LVNLPNQASIAKYMFSATMQPAIQDLVKKVMVEPLKVQIGVQNSTASTIKQNIVYVGREDAKLITLRQSLKEGFEPPMLIFVQSK